MRHKLERNGSDRGHTSKNSRGKSQSYLLRYEPRHNKSEPSLDRTSILRKVMQKILDQKRTVQRKQNLAMIIRRIMMLDV